MVEHLSCKQEVRGSRPLSGLATPTEHGEIASDARRTRATRSASEGASRGLDRVERTGVRFRSPASTPILIVGLVVGEGIAVAGVAEADTVGKAVSLVAFGIVFAFIVGLNIRSRRQHPCDG